MTERHTESTAKELAKTLYSLASDATRLWDEWQPTLRAMETATRTDQVIKCTSRWIQAQHKFRRSGDASAELMQALIQTLQTGTGDLDAIVERGIAIAGDVMVGLIECQSEVTHMENLLKSSGDAAAS